MCRLQDSHMADKMMMMVMMMDRGMQMQSLCKTNCVPLTMVRQLFHLIMGGHGKGPNALVK